MSEEFGKLDFYTQYIIQVRISYFSAHILFMYIILIYLWHVIIVLMVFLIDIMFHKGFASKKEVKREMRHYIKFFYLIIIGNSFYTENKKGLIKHFTSSFYSYTSRIDNYYFSDKCSLHFLEASSSAPADIRYASWRLILLNVIRNVVHASFCILVP